MEYVERTFAYLTSSVKGHDSKLFTRSPPFTKHPSPTIFLTSPDCGPSGSHVDIDHTQDGKDLFPSLTWSLPSSIPKESVKEYLLIIEDPDAPLPSPVLHSAFYCIPASKTSFTHQDLAVGAEGGNRLQGGVRYGKNLRGTVYSGPKPLRGHGEHRYFYQVVALGEGVEVGKMSSPARKEELVAQCNGRVLGWGEWVGVCERK